MNANEIDVINRGGEDKVERGMNKDSNQVMSQLKQNLRSKASPSTPGVTFERNNDMSQLKQDLRSRASVSTPGVTFERNNDANGPEKVDRGMTKDSNQSMSQLKQDLRNRASLSIPGVTFERNDDMSQLKQDLRSRASLSIPGDTKKSDQGVDKNLVESRFPESSKQDDVNRETEMKYEGIAMSTNHLADIECVEQQSHVLTAVATTIEMPAAVPPSTSQKSFEENPPPKKEKRTLENLCGRRTRCITTTFFCFVLFILVITVPVLLIDNKNEKELVEELETAPSSSPTLAPTSVPSSSPTTLANSVLTRILVSVFGEEYVTSGTTSHYAAREWMDEDLSNSGLFQDITTTTEIEQQKIFERYICSLMYFSLGGKNWKEQLNFLSDEDVCSWNDGEKGLFCEDGTIKQILMENNALSETIPSEIGTLSGLESIDMRKNIIGGVLPDSIGNLENLQTLDMGGNVIGGTIPSQIGNLTSIVTFSIPNNDFVGTIPSEIGKLVNAKEVALSQNQLTGTIPSQFGNLKSSKMCYLQMNFLTGTVPVELLSLSNLLILRVENNYLTGSIEVCEIPNLGADCKGKKGMGDNVEVKCALSCCSWCCNRDAQCSVNEPA